MGSRKWKHEYNPESGRCQCPITSISKSWQSQARSCRDHKGADIDERPYQNLQTHRASLTVRGGREAMVELMINRGALIDVRDPDGLTLLG